MDRIKGEIADLKQAISDLSKTTREKEKELVEEIRKQYPIVWVVLATAKNMGVSHEVSAVCFSTKEKAKQACGPKMKSLDGSTWWTYKIYGKGSDDVYEATLLNLDINTSDFPYNDL